MLTSGLLALLTTTAIAVAIGKPIEAADDLMANEAILSSPLASTAAAAAAPPGGNHGSTSQQHVSTTDTDASRNLEMLSSLGQVPPPPLPPASWPLPPPASLEPRGGTGTAATTTEVEVVTAAAAAGDLAFPTTSNSTSPAIVERGVRTENAALGKKFLCSKMYLWFDNQWGLAVPSEWWQEKVSNGMQCNARGAQGRAELQTGNGGSLGSISIMETSLTNDQLLLQYDNDAKAACHDYKKSVRHAFGGYLHYKWNCYKLDSEEAVRWQAYDPYILAASGWLRK